MICIALNNSKKYDQVQILNHCRVEDRGFQKETIRLDSVVEAIKKIC
jgi:hypothetical protein